MIHIRKVSPADVPLPPVGAVAFYVGIDGIPAAKLPNGELMSLQGVQGLQGVPGAAGAPGGESSAFKWTFIGVSDAPAEGEFSTQSVGGWRFNKTDLSGVSRAAFLTQFRTTSTATVKGRMRLQRNDGVVVIYTTQLDSVPTDAGDQFVSMTQTTKTSGGVVLTGERHHVSYV